MEAQTPLARGPVSKTVCAARPCRFDSCRFRHLWTVGREVRHRHARPANPKGCGGSIPPPSAIRARSPNGRRRHLEVVNSAGSNPAARTNATVAQLAGGSGLKPRAMSVRIRPVAPHAGVAQSAEAAGLNPAQCPFESDRQHGSLSAQPAVTRPTSKQSGGRREVQLLGDPPIRPRKSRSNRIGNHRDTHGACDANKRSGRARPPRG
jgi:hypothetical protein